jgi:hypothetical protein
MSCIPGVRDADDFERYLLGDRSPSSSLRARRFDYDLTRIALSKKPLNPAEKRSLSGRPDTASEANETYRRDP